MGDSLSSFREAIRDNQHPLHQATWLLFGQKLSPKSADRFLGDQKSKVIQLCLEILDTDELYNESALGSGNAPINSVQLLAHWQVREAVPHMLRILEEEDFETIIHDRTVVALEEMGPAILDDVLYFAERAKKDEYVELGAILSEIGKGDERAYTWVRARFEEQQSEHDIRFWAEMLLELGGEEAVTLLEERILKQKRKYSKYLRDVLRGYIQNLREQGRP